MRLTIHQPEHLPWLGFLAKAAAADELVLLDTVPYRHHYFQNRNKVLLAGAPAWLTVPVQHRGHLERSIRDMVIDEGRPWRRQYLGRLRDAYRRAPGADDVIPALTALVEQAGPSLAGLNEAIIAWLFELLGVTTPVRRASDLEARGQRSELLSRLAAERGASRYLSGPSGRDYLSAEPFAERGIQVEFYDFVHPTYPQPGEPEFVSHLSAVDLVASVGAASARRVFDEAVASSSISGA